MIPFLVLMNLKTLSSFIVLAEELHFGRAAHQCGISQPAMSRLLSELETELGVKLLNRTSREVSLTNAGRGFLDSAKKAVAYADMAVRAAKAGAVDGIDSLTIGMMIGAAQPFGGLHRQHLGTIPLSVLVQSDHELAKKDAVSLGDLADQPFIFPARDRQPIIWDTYRQHTAQYGFEPLIVIDVSTLSDTLAMVAGGVGVGNAPVVSGLKYPGVSILKQRPLFELNYQLTWLHKAPSVTSLLEQL